MFKRVFLFCFAQSFRRDFFFLFLSDASRTNWPAVFTVSPRKRIPTGVTDGGSEFSSVMKWRGLYQSVSHFLVAPVVPECRLPLTAAPLHTPAAGKLSLPPPPPLPPSSPSVSLFFSCSPFAPPPAFLSQLYKLPLFSLLFPRLQVPALGMDVWGVGGC